MGTNGVNQFLTHLAVKDRVTASTQTQALCAIVFLYKYVLNTELGSLDGLIRAKKKKNLPVVFTREKDLKIRCDRLDGRIK